MKRPYTLVLGGLLAACALLSSPAQAQTWMVSTDVYAKIGVLDKYGALGAYTAEFLVVDENSNEYRLIKQVPDSLHGVDVLFPSLATDADYFQNRKGAAAPRKPGNYRWECWVKGVQVVGGRFTLGETKNDVVIVPITKP